MVSINEKASSSYFSAHTKMWIFAEATTKKNNNRVYFYFYSYRHYLSLVRLKKKSVGAI